MNKKKQDEQKALRKRFFEMSDDEHETLITRLSSAIHLLGRALYDCGFTNGQCMQMLAFTVASLMTPPKEAGDLFYEQFAKELKRCYEEIDEEKKLRAKGGDV